MATKTTEKQVKTGLLSDERDYVKIVYYGDPGTGKTTHLAQLARLGPVVYVDAEAGIKRSAMLKRAVPVEEITPIRGVAFEKLEKLFFDLKGRLGDDPDAIAGLCIDSLTEVQKALLEIIVRDSVERTRKKGLDRSQFDIFKEDWGVNTEQLRQLIRKFRDLPCHVGFACLSRRDQDDDGGVIYGPALTPAFQTDLMGYVDIICHTRTMMVPGWGDTDEMMLGDFRRAGKYVAKDRFSILPKTLVDPTFDRVVQYIEGTLTEKTDSVMEQARAAWKERDKKEEASGENAA